MKTNILLTILLCLSISVFSQIKRFSVSTNLLNLAVSGPSASLSYQYAPKLAFQVYGSSGNFNKYLHSSQYQFKTAILDINTFYLKSYTSAHISGILTRKFKERDI
ncbi:DUF3575 domain-containing protein [Pedobacter superstes]|uniref:DUF3575 domain-containing protein n=1 Tax=Pedobacter superstes TaxID=3133441 RepID=UPI003D71B4F6